MTKNRLGLLSLTFLSLSGVTLYAYLGSFTRMLADDFCSIYFADRLGLFRSVWYWYRNWSGRYTAFAADWLVLKAILGPYRLHYIIPVTILFWLIFVTFAIHLSLEKKHPSAYLHAAALGSVFLFLVLVLTPDIPQSLYWWNGMRSYALPLVLFSLYLLLFQAYKRFNIPPVLADVLGFLLFFVSGGLGETMAVAQAAFLICIIAFYLLKLPARPGSDLTVLYGSLAGALCSLIVVILSPGNRTRQALLPPPPGLLTLVSVSLQAYGNFIGGFLREPARIAGLLGALLAALWAGGQYRDLISSKPWLIPASILAGILISFACFPPGVYGYSEPPPARIDIIPIFFLVAGLLCGAFLLGAWLAGRYAHPWLVSSPFLFLSILVLGFSALTTVSNLYRERTVYVDFARKWDQVDARIRQAKAQDLASVSIPAMDNWAGLERPNENKKYWPTLCYSDHYGIQVVGPPYSE
ncbi:MAG: DUF6056 family protein [Bacteroidota bacterium]